MSIIRLVPTLLALVVTTVSAQAAPESWGASAIEGGALVDIEVLPEGALQVVRVICPSGRISRAPQKPNWEIETLPSPGSRLVGLLTTREGHPTFIVPDLAWTRWALELSPVYRESVCRVLAKEGKPDVLLRPGWRDLLGKIDQRARDEASRLAVAFPGWANDLTREEMTLLIEQISVFPVSESEALRWFVFFRRVPPGPNLLLLLRVAENSSKPFFRTFVRTYKQLMADDKRFAEFCRGLQPQERPQACPSIRELSPQQ